jgi:ruvA N terminal domain
MIAYIKGKIAEVRQDSLVIENSGFGIEVFVPQNVLNSYSLQKEVMLYTYFKISEDALVCMVLIRKGI